MSYRTHIYIYRYTYTYIYINIHIYIYIYIYIYIIYCCFCLFLLTAFKQVNALCNMYVYLLYYAYIQYFIYTYVFCHLIMSRLPFLLTASKRVSVLSANMLISASFAFWVLQYVTSSEIDQLMWFLLESEKQIIKGALSGLRRFLATDFWQFLAFLNSLKVI